MRLSSRVGSAGSKSHYSTDQKPVAMVLGEMDGRDSDGVSVRKPDTKLARVAHMAKGAFDTPEYSPPPQGPATTAASVAATAAEAIVGITSFRNVAASAGAAADNASAGSVSEHASREAGIPTREPRAAPRQRDTTASSGDDECVTLFPRRKAGQTSPGGGGGPVVLKLSSLEMYFQMPLHLAAKRLGLCQTAIKKACRRLGVQKWPYKEMRTPWGKDSNGEETGLEVTRVAPSKASSLAALTAVSAKALGASAKRVKSESVARRAKPEAPARDSADVMSAVNALLSLQQ